MNGGAVMDALLDSLENPKHTHSHWVKRPWWKWEIRYDPGELNDEIRRSPHFYIISGDWVEVRCFGTLFPRAKARVEQERNAGYTRIVASRQYHCAAPVVGDDKNVVLYAAARLD